MIKKRLAILTAAGLLGATGLAACGSSGSTSATTATTSAATAAAPDAGGQAPTGQPPAGGAGFGTPVTGSAATKASDAATAKYAGTVERVMKLSDGSYVVHVVTSSGEVHVKVSKAFAVTGVEQGGPPAGAAPSSSTPSSTSSAGATSS